MKLNNGSPFLISQKSAILNVIPHNRKIAAIPGPTQPMIAPIAKIPIIKHQGLLFIESTEGAGTTVTIVLPLYEPEEVEKTSEDEIPLSSASQNTSEETNEQM